MILVLFMSSLAFVGCATNRSWEEKNLTRPGAVNGQHKPGDDPGGNHMPSPDMLSGSPDITVGVAATTIKKDTAIDGTTYVSMNGNGNALRIDGATVHLSDITVKKTAANSSTDTEKENNSSGQDAALLAIGGAQTSISDAAVVSNAEQGDAIVSSGMGTDITINDSMVTTAGNNSSGIKTIDGGTIHATDLDVTTSGNRSPAVMTGRAGGKIVVEGGNFVTSGKASPAIYAAGDISASDTIFVANSCEGAVIEGCNNVILDDCTLSGVMKDADGNNAHGVRICRGSLDMTNTGEASLSVTGGSIATGTGDLFYVSGSDATIMLDHVGLTSVGGMLLTVTGNDNLQKQDANETSDGHLVFVAKSETLSGKVAVNGGSFLQMELSKDSTFSGSINETVAKGKGSVIVKLDDTSTWKLTGDSYITTYDGNVSQIDLNGYMLYINGIAVLK
jgi:hypothetical protein